MAFDYDYTVSLQGIRRSRNVKRLLLLSLLMSGIAIFFTWWGYFSQCAPIDLVLGPSSFNVDTECVIYASNPKITDSIIILRLLRGVQFLLWLISWKYLRDAYRNGESSFWGAIVFCVGILALLHSYSREAFYGVPHWWKLDMVYHFIVNRFDAAL